MQDEYPFCLPLIQGLTSLSFRSPVTFFVGENGTGKSTILEAIAVTIGFPTIGHEDAREDPTLAKVRNLSKFLRLAWQHKSHRGFFLRAEDFFNFTRRLSSMRSELLARLRELDEEYEGRSSYARSLAKMPYLRSLAEMEEKYGEDLDAHSHGESFLELFHSRIVPKGLYLMDEPEAPLSPMRQLSLISLIREMVEQDCQFIIATHSPILMAFPGATILSFETIPPQEVPYEELEHVQLTKAFLDHPELFLRHL
jgi:predicted ATPase